MPGKKIIVVGGGAAGFFAAINLAEKVPGLDITILEKTGKLLSKVRISGGGRCNVTNNCFDIDRLLSGYPRGFRELRQVFARFSVGDTVDWFRRREVRLKTEDDGRMFPDTDDSATIIECFLREAGKHHVSIKTLCEVFLITKKENRFNLSTGCGELTADFIICASGGHSKKGSYNVIRNLGHKIIDPLPSLFTFNLPGEKIRKDLQGIVARNATVRIEGSRLLQNGPVLITHWGLSGPAVLKLSAFGAAELNERNYVTEITVNWISLGTDEAVSSLKALQHDRKVSSPFNTPAFDLPARLWEHHCENAGIERASQWAGVSKKQISALAEQLCRSKYQVEGKTTFKEEFVTCGGVDLREVDFRTMQSKLVPGLYFCGEVLNIDGVTGGFNFQSAWSTAWLCASAICEKLK